MRLWSIHPRYLDRQGLTACWREGLLAQAVVVNPGRGYSRHPQLERFRELEDPLTAVGAYLSGIANEADARGYHFKREKIRRPGEPRGTILVPQGQVDYEWATLVERMRIRSPEVWGRWSNISSPDPHPLFHVVPGPIASWERVPSPGVSAHQ